MPTHACLVVSTFSDDTEAAQVFRYGTLEECTFVFDNIPAIDYSGKKTVVDSRLLVIPIDHLPLELRPCHPQLQ